MNCPIGHELAYAMNCTDGAWIAYGIKNRAIQFMKTQSSNHEATRLLFMTQRVNSLLSGKSLCKATQKHLWQTFFRYHKCFFLKFCIGLTQIAPCLSHPFLFRMRFQPFVYVLIISHLFPSFRALFVFSSICSSWQKTARVIQYQKMKKEKENKKWIE